MANNKPLFERPQKKRAFAEQRGVIKYHIIFRLAYRNLFFKKLRTTLTIFGVVIGIGSIVFLLSFGFGLQNLVSKQVVGSNSVQTIDVSSSRSKLLKLNQDAINQIKGMQGVTETARSYNSAGRTKLQSSQTENVVFGVEPGYIDLSSLQFQAGSNFDGKKDDRAVINTTLAKALGITNYQKAINQKLTVSFDTSDSNGVKQTVVKDVYVSGVFASEENAQVFVSSSLFESAGTQDAAQLKVVVPEKDSIANVRKAIESMGFTTTSPLDTVEQINQFFTLLRFVLLGFGGIGMVIAVLGMFNTLTISLLERTREIGLMISLGARKQDVKRLFFTEAFLLSSLGGLLGVIGALIAGGIGNVVLNSFARHNGVKEHITAFVVSPSLAFGVLLVSGIVGLVVVYFPARRASQINPIDALHFE